MHTEFFQMKIIFYIVFFKKTKFQILNLARNTQ